jgi:hypothetical protein
MPQQNGLCQDQPQAILSSTSHFAHAQAIMYECKPVCTSHVEMAEMKTRLQFGETQSKPIILPLSGTQLESE